MTDITKLQDCNVVAEAFERGIHFDASEASVYAPLTRNIQNTRSFARGAQKSLASYKIQPSLALNAKTNAPDSASQTGMKIQNQYITVPDASAGSILARAVKECIPCDFRILHNLDMNLGADLLKALKADLENRLKVLNAIGDLFSNVDIYGDYCQMVSFLHFMCVPDLQRMLVVLMAMLTDFGLNLGRLTGLLQLLIAPFFTPVLLSINALLDQLVKLVLSPLTCIITSIEENIRKLNVGALVGDSTLTSAQRKVDVKGRQVKADVLKFQGQARSGLMELHLMLLKGDALLRNKLSFYTSQLDKLLHQWGQHDLGYTAQAGQKLIIVRLIALIRAMIKARSKGASICQNSNKPSSTELDNFFNTFISPNSPFNISVDTNGALRLTEKPKDAPSTATKNIDSIDLLVAPFLPVNKVFNCSFTTSAEDVDKVNKWMAELDSV